MLIDGFVSAAAGGSPQAVPIFWWQGYSGRYHLTSIFDLRNLDCREPGAFIVARREENGDRTPLFIGLARSVSDDIYDDYGDELMRAIRAGANEIHVHFGSDCAWLRDVLLDDIASGWSLNPARSPAFA